VEAMDGEYEKVLREINRNYWLSGMADIVDGDPLAGLEDNEMINHITVAESIEELWSFLESYQGTFKYKNLYFANHIAYGCFVYIVKNGEVKEFEHISFEEYDRFRKWIQEVLEIDKATTTVSEFLKKYFS
jgi:hypothetical protein